VRIVLDSSVLIAAHISRAGVCAELLEDVLMQHQLVTSQYILDELARKLTEKFHFPLSLARGVVRFLGSVAEMVEPESLPANTCRDPRDIAVLGTAAAAKADLLITVDNDLLILAEFRAIPIIKPGEFWKRTNS
jgi:putative PIN family toxin of toxin-antitoxin system